MRILHVIANLAPRYGGPSKACFEMARAVARLGHDVRIFTTNQDGPAELAVPTDRAVFKDGVAVHYFPIQRPRFWGTSWPLARGLRDAIREADVVHIHSLYLFHDMVAGHYCRKYGVPYLIRPHGTLDPYLHRRHRGRKRIADLLFENRDIRHAAAIHFTADEERSLAAPYVFEAAGIVVPLGIETSEYEDLPEAGAFRERYPESKGKKIILFLGRLNFKKGLDILVQSFARIARERDDAHLVLSGPDNDGYGAKVRSWLEREGVRSHCTITGMLLGKDKLAAMRDANVFVLPSYTENFGLSVVEAMACGLPVIISDKVNLWREVATAGAGLVAPCDPLRFFTMINDLLDDPLKAKAFGEKGRALVRERFSWSRAAKKLEGAYDSLIGA